APEAPLRAVCFEDEGFYCEQGACAALRELGAACTQDDECGYLAYCSGTCQKRSVQGESCATVPCVTSLTCQAEQCVSPPFASDYTCEGHSLGPF
ncbi:MAG TPA: hypothetical protein VHM19_18955, partial [Polyangiales bacterium]|nr:hypothetical protein [Polyangiales bacterium]